MYKVPLLEDNKVIQFIAAWNQQDHKFRIISKLTVVLAFLNVNLHLLCSILPIVVVEAIVLYCLHTSLVFKGLVHWTEKMTETGPDVTECDRTVGCGYPLLW